ncbi:g protein-coupled receptor [Anaeramoeba flamelloides]|uniref:G protein-coupled receptor n=1 Tax=Anaeramoeba flamelloides TaxID=1746091 RepID=A0AAV7Y560_9EUKA|nr:g protein-coupled receptor [Anaeramoeba flamelloides]KAJ6251950.1 g protein-coupled receptor [Anaeramoeba flamelloides]
MIKSYIEIISFCMLGLSSLSYLILVVSFILFGNLKKLHRKYLFTLAVYDLMSDLIDILPGKTSPFLCNFQAVGQSFLSPLPPFWSAAISITTYLRLVGRRSERSLHRLYRVLHICVIPLCLLVMLLAILTGGGNPSQTYWCTSSDKTLIVLYSWYWVMIATSLIFSILTVKQIRKILREANGIFQNNKKNNRFNTKKQTLVQLKMLVVPIVFIWCYIWPSITRIYEITNHKVTKGLLVMHILNFELSGPIYCVVFVFSSAEIRQAFQNYKWPFFCFKKKKTRTNFDLSDSFDDENDSLLKD